MLKENSAQKETSNPDQFFEGILVAIVIYKMKINDSPAFNTLTKALQFSKQSAALFIYDNSPNPQTFCHEKNWEITYQHDPTNPGVSKAYNQTFDKGKGQKKKWILLIDQDTSFPLDAFEQYKKCFNEHNLPIIVPHLLDHRGRVSPFQFFLGSGFRKKKVITDVPLSINKYLFANSGLFISFNQFEKAGKYDERLPLDFSDFAFVYKLRKENTRFVVANIHCEHVLSPSRRTTFLERFNRFRSYLEASRYFKLKYAPQALMLSLRSLLMAIKLTIQYRNIRFLLLYYR